MEEASKEVINYVYKFIDWISNLKIEALQEQYKFIDKVPEEKITGIFKKNTIPQFQSFQPSLLHFPNFHYYHFNLVSIS